MDKYVHILCTGKNISLRSISAHNSGEAGRNPGKNGSSPYEMAGDGVSMC